MYSQLVGMKMRGGDRTQQATPTCRCQIRRARGAGAHLRVRSVRRLHRVGDLDSRGKGIRTKILCGYDGGFEVDHAAAK
jgi:hypothetical protein